MKPIPLIVLITLVASLTYVSFKAGYYNRMVDFEMEWAYSTIKNKQPRYYSIVDANGVEHRTACHGYTLLSADSVELCNGVKIKYSKKKPINVIPK